MVCAVEAAAAVWGLPRIESWPGFVRHHVSERRVRGSILLRPHLGAEVDPVQEQGLLVTPVARTVGDLADPLSVSPGESLSRVQMFRLNLPRPELQHEVHDDDGLAGVVDFWWERVVGEFDGKMKYRVPDGASAEEATEIVWREKKREDRLRRRAAVGRWIYREALQPHVLARILAQAGDLQVPCPARWREDRIEVLP